MKYLEIWSLFLNVIYLKIKTKTSKVKKYVFLLSVILGLVSCSTPETADHIIEKAILKAGGDHYNHKKISFEFRDKTYTSCREDGVYALTRITDDSVQAIDVLSNKGFKRIVEGQELKLADTTKTNYANSVNSVHYFAYLPYGLTGTAVNKELLGEVQINDRTYYKIKVWFDQEGGGEDYEDVFVYWVEKESYQLDYLAYEFHVNDGGMRFRQAFNRRVIDGIQFVDYNNYQPKNESTSLFDLDSLYQLDELELLSKIELKNVRVEASIDCQI